MAILVIGLFASGIWMVDLDYYSSWYVRAPQWHIAVGMLVLLLLILRVLWHRVSRKPEVTAQGWQRPAAKLAHGMLYLLMFALCISGYLIPAADGSVAIFDWFELPGGKLVGETQASDAGWLHRVGGWGLIILSGLHALAALKHQFVDRDGTLKRMFVADE